ncbi:substrate-binding periplasmic protein [Vibrio marisflavi]|uniref:Solute-binding protein family 3/N-terminal domain-containing protein n=1 Tax=Vibrio marisflavi CECT 7928 TaxID=634439 RepID=A0ABM9A1N0_9VIBR|nr:transporter substrate-binding domain-containing protein [Vibrio marisflavi]CAH0537717.1 hypothetical protein VMF7928_01269 [Vibrio marisflavi CECT 7928]
MYRNFAFSILLMPFLVFSETKSELTINHSYFKPYVWAEKGEASQGIYVDILKEAIEVRMNIPIKFQSYPWTRAQMNVQKGIDDGFITIPTSERLEYSIANEVPIIIEKVAVFTYPSHPERVTLEKAQTINDLKPYKIISYLGNGWAKKNLVDHEVDYGSKDLLVSLQKLIKRRGDIIVGSKIVTLYNLKKYNLIHQITRVADLKKQVNLKLLIGRKSEYRAILKQLDSTLKQMEKDGTRDKIISKYIKANTLPTTP